VLDLESRILRALCSGSRPHPSARVEDPVALAALHATILALLRAYHWQNPEHRIVFEALTLLPARQATELREQLPAQATRMGFPDINWDNYFAEGADNLSAEALLKELLAASHEKEP
jgi:hypothetical protein